ncbi:sugar lyase [Oenococcus oeni]|uniref:Sugar lyase n=1 Tax=Oenococcus oeni TaxID=1247 RepID=A0A6N4A8B1_OENOE|nr:polysaccharide biosynthesis protein [Oenococcus oeni]OIM21721.1 sugar lyase [Oenococcus oeni]
MRFKKNIITGELAKGTSWLTLGNVVSRLLGAIYVIPWTLMLGILSLQANTLFGKGYNVYQLFLMMSTVGLPSAVAKYTSVLVGKEKDLFLEKAFQLSLFSGLLFGVIFWILAPILAVGDINLIPVLHSLVPAVIIFPFLSVLRGKFQGQLDMEILAKSDIIEQLIRIVYMLLSAFSILDIFHGNWVNVVIQSTFAAFIGALAAIIYLLYKLYFSRSEQIHLFSKNKLSKNSSFANSFKSFLPIVKQSIPFVFIGGFLTFYQWIDQYTFFPLMRIFHPDFPQIQLEDIFGRFNFNANKLIMLIVSLAMSVASTILPIISKNSSNLKETRNSIARGIKMLIAIISPSALIMYALAKPIYIIFYGKYGSLQDFVPIVQVSALLSVFMSSVLLAMILQGIGKTRVVIKAIIYGIIFKILFQPFLIIAFPMLGAMMATFVGLIVSTVTMFVFIEINYHVSQDVEAGFLSSTFVSSIIMFALVCISDYFIQLFVSDSRIGQFLPCLISSLIGLFIIIKCYKTNGILDEILTK